MSNPENTLIERVRYICVKSGVAAPVMGAICLAIREEAADMIERLAARPVAAPLREQIIEECASVCEAQMSESTWETFAGRSRVHLDPANMMARKCAAAIRALSAAPQPERNDMPLRDGGFANATFEGIGSVHSDRRTRSPMAWGKHERRGVTWAEDAAAPNNAGEQKPVHSAIATSERPDRASGDRGTLLMPIMHNPAHTEPFAVFVQAMADELRANAHKGDRAGWLTMSEREAVSEVMYHAAKLAYSATKHKRGDEPARAVLEHAADVANCALMVADVCGALDGDSRDALQTASSANGNAVAGESPDARDARRYRFLKQCDDWFQFQGYVECEPDGLDAAVDAAMGSPTDE